MFYVNTAWLVSIKKLCVLSIISIAAYSWNEYQSGYFQIFSILRFPARSFPFYPEK